MGNVNGTSYSGYPGVTGYPGTTKPPSYRERKAQAEAMQAMTVSISTAQQLTGQTLDQNDVMEAMTLVSQMPSNSDVKLQGTSYDQQRALAFTQAQQDASAGESPAQVLADLMWGDQAMATKDAVNDRWMAMMKSFTAVKAPEFVKVKRDGGSDLGLNDVDEGE